MAEPIKNVRLQAEAGKKWEETKEAIGFYSRSIVFLPRGSEPGKIVRVDLLEIEKKDVRGRAMYRATPAAAVESERWREEEGGSLSRARIATDWLGNEREIAVLENHPAEHRESETGTRSEFVPIWGADLASSYVEEHPQKVFKTYEEKVENGALVNRKVSERTEPQPVIKQNILQLDHEENLMQDWWRARLDVEWQTRKVTLNIQHTALNCSSMDTSCSFLYPETPAFWRTSVEGRYPVCACGRQRRDARVADGYGKCEICRVEDHCSRCGKQAKVTVIDGNLACDACRPLAQAEALVAAHWTANTKAAIAAEAKRLRAGGIYPQEEGEVLLRASTDHLAPDDLRHFIRDCAGHGWHYWTDDGIFGGKFSTQALELLEYLPQASGNALVEFAAWVASSDFYQKSQVEGATDTVPSIFASDLEDIARRAESGQPVLAVFLRGSEEDRRRLANGVSEFEHASDNAVTNSVVGNASRLLTPFAGHDYRESLKKLAEIRARCEASIEKRVVGVGAGKVNDSRLAPATLETPAEEVQFESLGDFNFLCPCGRSFRLTKSERRQYNAGTEITVHCACTRRGTVKKPTET